MATAQLLEDESLLSRLDRGLFCLETILALVSGLSIFSLMLLAVISIAGRNLFNSPLPGYVDMIEQLMPLIAYAGLAYCHRLGGHVRMDFIINALPKRVLWLVESVISVLYLLLTLALIWGSFAHFQRSFDFASPLWSRDSSLDIALPLWPMKLVIPVVFAIFSLRLILHIWGYGRAFAHNEARPIAVPLPENAADVAAREAGRVKQE